MPFLQQNWSKDRQTKEQDLFQQISSFGVEEGLGVDDTTAHRLIRIVFWSILLFIAIRVVMAMILPTWWPTRRDVRKFLTSPPAPTRPGCGRVHRRHPDHRAKKWAQGDPPKLDRRDMRKFLTSLRILFAPPCQNRGETPARRWRRLKRRPFNVERPLLFTDAQKW